MTPTFARQPLPEERKVLEDWIKNPPSRDHYIRARIVLLSADGLSAPDIARRIGRHESRVRMWIRQFNRFGIEGLQSGKLPEAQARKANAHTSEPVEPEANPLESPLHVNEHLSDRGIPKGIGSNRWAIFPVLEHAEGE
jgi:hypothetical protein